MNDRWDGVSERRAANVFAAGFRKETLQVNAAVVVVGFTAIVLLNIAGLIGNGILSARQKGDAVKAERFRQQISCFVVGSAQGKTGTDLLTDCKFIQLGEVD